MTVEFYVERLRTDARFAAEMAYCGPRGIPHSVFLSWPDDDQDKALAAAVAEGARCSRCGTYRDEWVQPDGRTRPEPPYEAVLERCFGCQELDAAMAELRKAGADTDGVMVGLRRFDPDGDED